MMDSIYYWTGAIVFWIVVVAIAAYLSLLLSGFFYGMFMKWFRTTKLWHYRDWYVFHRKFIVKKKNFNGSGGRMFDFERAIRNEVIKHHYGDRLIKDIHTLLEMYPECKVEYDHSVDYFKKDAAEFLKENGWSTYYNEDYWVNKKVTDGDPNKDYTNHGLSLEAAYYFEKRWQKKQEEKNNA